MPFSFKPTQGTQTGETATTVSAPGVSTFAQAGQTLMNRASDETTTDIFTILIYLITAGTIITTIALTAYHSYLETQVSAKKDALATYEKKLGGLPLVDMQRLSNRFKILGPLLKDHPSVNTVFRVLEDSVENPITYTRFDMHLDDTSKAYILALSASSPDYKSVIQQLDTFKRKPYSDYLGAVSVEGLRPDDTGRVLLNMKMPLLIKGALPENLLLENIISTVATTTQDVGTVIATTTVGQMSTTTQQGPASTSTKPTNIKPGTSSTSNNATGTSAGGLKTGTSPTPKK